MSQKQTKKIKHVSLTISMPEEEREKIMERANKIGVPVSFLVRRLISSATISIEE